jgi:glycosyltransferase involved in cell wall biosynthesis
VLFVAHNRGGGTERHIRQLERQHAHEDREIFVARPSGEQTISIRSMTTDPLPNLELVDLRAPGHLERLLRMMGISRVHVHSLADFDQEGRGALFRAFANEGLPYDVTVHDYLPVCPRITLISDLGRYCQEPSPAGCQHCLRSLGSDFGSPDILQWRAEFAEILAGARTVLVPHEDVARRIEDYFPGIDALVRPHVEHLHFPQQVPDPDRDSLRHIVLVGALGEHKGSAVLAAVARSSSALGLPLRFTVIGYTDRDAELHGLDNVRITGHYQDEDLPDLLRRHRVDVFWLPAVWPETFSFTLSAALASGRPVVTFDLGAPAARLRELGRGQHALPLRLIDTPAVLAQALHEISLTDLDEGLGAPPTVVYPDVASYYGIPGAAS